MDLFFEIKYLELKWYNQEILTKVTESLVPLEVEYDENLNIYQVETTIYPKVEGVKRGVLAVRFLNRSSDKPYIEMSSGEKKYLSPITDPDTGLVWWIVKDRWVKEHNQWSSIAPNIVGTVYFVLQGQRCEILINGSDFSLDQLDKYLSTFKNDLWELILDESSVVQAKAKGGQSEGIGDEAIKCIESLVAHTQKVLNKPKVELREVQSLKPRKEVKPVNRTFMELSTKTNQKFLTSRATEPSYNVPENRYVLFALERCSLIIKQIVILARNKMQRFKHQAEKFQAQHDTLKDYTKVDRDLMVSDLQKIGEKRKVSYWQNYIDTQVAHFKIPLVHKPLTTEFQIKLESRTSSEDGFFIQVWHKNKYVKPPSKYYILELAGTFEELVNIFDAGMELVFHCDFSHTKYDKCVKFRFNDIYKITFLRSDAMDKASMHYEREVQIGIELDKNNWIRSLTANELKEQEKEKVALRNRINYYWHHQNNCTQVYEKVEPKFRFWI